MDNQISSIEKVLQDIHSTDSDDANERLISQEPERLDDSSLVHLCYSCECMDIDELPDVLLPLAKRLLDCTGGTDADGTASRETNEERESVLREMISEVLDLLDEFESFEHYVWLVKFSCALCLLKNLPAGMSFEFNKIIRSVAAIDKEEYEFRTNVIHDITKAVFEDIPIEGMNLVYVIKKLSVLNQTILYHVSVALVFAGLRHCIHQEKSSIDEYRLYGFDDLLCLLDKFPIENLKPKQDMRVLFLVLKLVSCYQNAVLLRHSHCSWEELQEQHKNFAEFFRITVPQKKAFVQWLVNVRNIISNINSQSEMRDIGLKEDLMLVSELIDIDMLALMEDDLEDGTH